MPDSYQERTACPLYTAIGVIEGRWKPMIYQRLVQRPHGFGELQRAMPRVTAKVLREQLRQMEADTLLVSERLMPARLGVRYRLTPYGRTLGPVFTSLWKWGVKHLAQGGTERGTRVRPPVSTAAALCLVAVLWGTSPAHIASDGGLRVDAHGQWVLGSR